MNEQTSNGTNVQKHVSRRRSLALAGGVLATGMVACDTPATKMVNASSGDSRDWAGVQAWANGILRA